MTEWVPVPEPVTWQLSKPIEHNGVSYATVTLSAPLGEHLLKATAVPGASSTDVALRLISAVSSERVPYEVAKKIPTWLVEQMTGYMDEFMRAPAPDPLEAWRKARLEAAEALAKESQGT